ncbi:MAG: serine/threonine-protein kinase [Gemmatimonadota bacterium]
MGDADRWTRLQALFHAIAALPESERASRLVAATRDDPTVGDDVRAMLAQDAAGASLLDRGVARTAEALLHSGADGPLPTETFGPYRVTALLGEGGMGVVYLGVRDDLDARAAIKILRDAWLSPARRERFASEQRTLAHLKHPGIAQLYDAGALPDGTPWFVMELVEGTALTDYCTRRELGLRERLRIVRDVCGAVQFAHAHAVIHRDIKPSNILVTEEGSPKLLDFGISKQLAGTDAPIDQTRSGMRLLTPAYSAPEQIRGAPVGAHTDVYSLGVLLYELLTGRLPFELSDRTPSEAATILLTEEVPRPSSVAGRVAASRAAWEDLDVLILTAMHRDAGRRYPTVEALARDLDHFLAGEPLEARPDSRRYRAAMFIRRHRLPVLAASVAVVVIGLVTTFYTVRLRLARDLAVAESERTQRIQAYMLQLFQGGDDAAGPADSLRVTTLLELGAREARALDGEPAVQADLYQTLGGIYQQLGRMDRADSLLTLAYARQRAIHGDGSREVAGALVALGRLRIDQARMDEAEFAVRAGLARLRRERPIDVAAVSGALALLGKALREAGKYDASIAVLDSAVALRGAADTATKGYATALTELASTHFQAGHYAIADSLDHLVLPLERRLHGPGHPLVAEILLSLGAIQFDQGSYPQAETRDREALALIQAWYGHDHPATASALTMLGRALVYQRKDTAAVSALQEALRIQERVFGPIHPRVASAVNELGNLAVAQDRLEDAEGHFRRMVEIYRAVYHDDHYLIGIALSNLASVFSARKEYPRAEATYRDALARFTAALGPEHSNTAIARIKLGRTLLRERRFAEAVVESEAGYRILGKQSEPGTSFLQAARKDIAAAYDTLGQPERGRLYRSEWERIAAQSAKKN